MGNLVKLCHAGDRALQLLLFNEEFLVSMSHQLTLIKSLWGLGVRMEENGVGYNKYTLQHPCKIH